MVNNDTFSFWPYTCLICDQSTDASQLCDICLTRISPATHSCPRCALPRDQASTAPCARCQRNPPRYGRCIAATIYNPASARLVNRLKHQRELPPARVMATAMAVQAGHRQQQASTAVSLLIPVPLSRKRLQWRGFNQAVEIARPLARQLALPLSANACGRRHNEASQQMLDLPARQHNLKDAFFIRKPEIIQNHRVAIVDDVMTTGATAEALCDALLAAGASHCDIWCFARTPRHASTVFSQRTRIIR